MIEFSKSTRVKAPEISGPSLKPMDSPNLDEVVAQNLQRRSTTENRKRRKGLIHQKKCFLVGQLNCRSLNSLSSKKELIRLVEVYNISVCTIQEHRIIHAAGDPQIRSHSFGSYTLFTASAWKASNNATIGGVGILIKNTLLEILNSVDKISDRIVTVSFKGNPKTTIISCYSPHSGHSEEEVEQFYQSLGDHYGSIPRHSFVIVGGDFNAHLKGTFSYHQTENRNGSYLHDFVNEHTLVACNTVFQKRKNSLWTWRSPNKNLFQIDYILCRRRWRNSVHDCQAHSSSDPIGSDHRIVVLKCKLSLRTTKRQVTKKINWKALEDDALAKIIEEKINREWEQCTNKSYSSYVDISLRACKKHLQYKKKIKENEPKTITDARSQVLNSALPDLQTFQVNLRNTYKEEEMKKINRILNQAHQSKSPANLKDAWNLVKELSGKKNGETVFIKSDNRQKTWKDHFESLLNNTTNLTDRDMHIKQIFPVNSNIPSEDFTAAEVMTALNQMKLGKATGLDELPLEFWKQHQSHLLDFCNSTLNGNRPEEWGLSAIVPVPKKGDLTKVDNYRGISLTQVGAKVYNRLMLNRIRPEIDKKLRFNQNGFRPSRSTSSQILALRRIIEEVKNHNMEAVITFIDFRKAFDSIDRTKMFKILSSYGIPSRMVDGIKAMYTDNKATVLTSEGQTDFFNVLTGVLQGDPLAPYLFIIVPDYALRVTIKADNDGLTIKRRKSRRHPAELLSDLDFADDIALLNESIAAAENFLHRLESSCQSIGLFLNAKKTQFMHLNPTSNGVLKSLDGTGIDSVVDFKYLGAFTDTAHDIDVRLALAWSALNMLEKIWKSDASLPIRIKIFKATVQSILLYSCESWSLTSTLTKKIDGAYTRMLRRVKNIPPSTHISNRILYDDLPRLSDLIQKRRLQLAGHVIRGDEPATKLLLWEPETVKRKIGRPHLTLKKLIERDTRLTKDEIVRLANDRERWRELVVSSLPSG